MSPLGGNLVPCAPYDNKQAKQKDILLRRCLFMCLENVRVGDPLKTRQIGMAGLEPATIWIKPVALPAELHSIMGCDQYLNKLVTVYKGVLIEYFRPSVCPSELLSLYNEQNE